MGHMDLNFTQAHHCPAHTGCCFSFFFKPSGHLGPQVCLQPAPNISFGQCSRVSSCSPVALPDRQKPDSTTLLHMLQAALQTENLGSHAAWQQLLKYISPSLHNGSLINLACQFNESGRSLAVDQVPLKQRVSGQILQAENSLQDPGQIV